jgi:hypothetical protein
MDRELDLLIDLLSLVFASTVGLLRCLSTSLSLGVNMTMSQPFSCCSMIGIRTNLIDFPELDFGLSVSHVIRLETLL